MCNSRTFGATKMTLMSFRKSTPSFCMTPSKKPCDRPSVAPGFIPARMRGYRSACGCVQHMTRQQQDHQWLGAA